MKYFIATYILLYSFCTQIHAQARLSVGIKAGTNTPGLGINSSDPVIDGFKTILEPYYGIVLETGLNKKWSLLTEVNYAILGITKNGSQVVPKSTYTGYEFGTLILPEHVYANFYSKIELNYIEIPCMLKYNFYQNKKLNIFFNAGPSVSVLLNAKVNTSGKGKIYSDEAHKTTITPFNFSFIHETDLTDWFNPLNFAFQGGAGLTYKTHTGDFFVNLEGNIGLMKIQAGNGDGSNNTKALNLSVGYLYHIWQ